MKSAFLTLPDGKQMHYRTAGEGPPLILLHPSPQNSEAMLPAINAFSKAATCIAFDTPGYGLSDGLDESKISGELTLTDYADRFIEALDALKVNQFAVYGSATGAQIAIELGKKYPDRACFVMLDSNGEFPDELCEKFVASGYFADVAPQRDGGHLLTYWDMCQRLFYAFPWYSDDPADRLGFDAPPADVVHATMLRYLQAGEDYADAYRPALYAENLEHLAGMKVLGTMMRWESSPVLSLADALIDRGLPENVTLLRAGHGVEARYAPQVAAMKARFDKVGLPSVAELGEAEAFSTGRGYLMGQHGKLHYIRSEGAGLPIILLHGAGQSADAILSRTTGLINGREVWALDLPHHGASDDLPSGAEVGVEAIADEVASALHAADLKAFEITAEGLGVAVAVRLAEQFDVPAIRALDPIPYSETERATARDGSLPDLTPRSDGTHTIAAWSYARDRRVSWPAWDKRAAAHRSNPLPTDPHSTHKECADMLRLGGHWRALLLLETELDWQTLLAPDIVQSVLSEHHPCPERLPD